MIELLKLCGFEACDIESDLPRVEKVFHRLGITSEDIERGKQRLNEYYDIKLQGVRKALRLHLRALTNLLLAREEGKTKLVYGFMVPAFEQIGAALVSQSREVFVIQPTISFQLILGCIFDKMVPVLEAAERKWLKSGAVAHCGNVKAILGLFALDLIPKPDLLITSGILCETAPKTVELLQECYDIPTDCLDSCEDNEVGEGQAPERIINLSSQRIRRLIERVQEVTGVEITDDVLRDAIDVNGKLGDAIVEMQVLLEDSDPLPLNTTHEKIWRGLPSTSIDDIPAILDAINTLYEELQERVNQGVGVVERGAPRILTYCPSHYIDPRPEHLIAQLGIAAVGTFFNLPATDRMRNPVPKNVVKDPYEKISQDLQCMFFPWNIQLRIRLYQKACKALNVDGVLDRFHVGCRNVAGDAMVIQDAIAKELGIPVLLLEWEDFDSRVYYNEEQFKRRLEVFKTMLTKNSS